MIITQMPNAVRMLIATLLAIVLSANANAESQLYFVHTDHLGTPQVVTDKNQNVVWKGEYTPFGEVKEVVNTLGQNVRFPGQYYDAETGLYYNYFRDYDPSIGRYIESDPIGLMGGLNTYTYVGGNPVNHIDPYGLYELAPGVPAPSSGVHEVLICIDTCTGDEVLVTATTNGHTSGAHAENKAADFIPPKSCSSDKATACALECRAAYVQDEYKYPSPKSSGDHIHMQTRPGGTPEQRKNGGGATGTGRYPNPGPSKNL